MKSRYFVSPAVDLMFVCGGAVFFFAACSWSTGWWGAQHQLAYFNGVAAAAALLLGETHTTATIVGLDQDQGWSDRLSRRGLWTAALSVSIAIALLASPALAPLAVRLYLLSVSWHFTRQAYGIMIMYCRKCDWRPKLYQKWLWQSLFHLTMINWIWVQLSNYFGLKEEIFLLQKIPPITVLPPVIVGYTVCLIALLALITAIDLTFTLARRPAKTPPLHAYLMLFSVVILFLPSGTSEAFRQNTWLYAPAMFHGSQYLCVMAERFKTSYAGDNSGLHLMALYGRCLALAAFFFIALPLLLHACFSGLGLSYATALVAVFVPVQIFHMAMDMVMWRRGEAKFSLRSLKLMVGHACGAVMHRRITIGLNAR